MSVFYRWHTPVHHLARTLPVRSSGCLLQKSSRRDGSPPSSSINTGPQLAHAYSSFSSTHKLLLSNLGCQQCDILQNKTVDCSYSQQRTFSRESFSHYLSSDFPPVGQAQECLMWVHSACGLPWWASIVLTTVALRTVITLPLSVYSYYVLAKVERLQPEIKELAKELAGEVAVATRKFQWEEKIARRHYSANMKRLIAKLYIRDNCHPFKASLVLWAQIPMWISISLALRNMAGALPVKGVEANIVMCPDMAYEGMLWFPDLLAADTTLILPISVGLLNLAITEMHALRSLEQTRTSKIITYVLRGMSVFMVPIAATVPSCMCLYWATSSLFGFMQNTMTKFPTVRRACGIPKTPSESSTPFQDMLAVAKQRYGKRFRKSTE